MRTILVMGIAGSGKSSVGRALAQRLNVRFVDADDLHPAANVEKMRRGVVLTAADRWPWLDAVAAQLNGNVVVACSALKESYRQRLKPTHVVYLRVPREELARRLAQRSGHFFPASLLDSQLADLEEPAGAIIVDASQSADALVEDITSRLKPRSL